MTLRLEHPQGKAPPPEWLERGRVPAHEVMEWLKSPAGRDDSSSKGGSKWKGKAGTRADLGHSCRSSMEANMERYLRYLGYHPWLEKHPSAPPLESGAWFYRYEGRRWDFTDARGEPIKTHTGFYLSDLEIWPGLIAPKRPYEVLEVKGYLDPASKTKLSRMAKQYPEVPLELITSQRFTEITTGCSSIIPGWE